MLVPPTSSFMILVLTLLRYSGVVTAQDVGALVEAVGEGHHRDVDEVFRHFGLREAGEARIDSMVKDGAVLHGQAVNEVFKSVFGVLIKKPQRHGVKLIVESDDTEIEAFLCRSVVFSLGLSATAESGEHDGKCQCQHGNKMLFHVLSVLKFSICLNVRYSPKLQGLSKIIPLMLVG